MINKKYISFILLTALINISCRETFELETENFESVLVVETTITNELKYQDIKLSRTYLLESNSEPVIENNAIVNITDNLNNTYSFSQNTDGVYVSDIEFEAEPNRFYTLDIATNDGKTFTSSTTTLPPVSQIDNLYPEYIINDAGEESIQVLVDSNNETTGAEYFRYEYEETYKIVAPHHSNFDISFENYNVTNGVQTYDIIITPREQEERICFTSKTQTDIIQYTTSILNENTISRFPVKKLATNTSKIRTRYSILVKQYTQNIEAYTFYRTLNDLGNIESILSQSQPGFIFGNIESTNNNDRVIGFFEVSAVDEQRIYFNSADFGLPDPPYFFECNVLDLNYLDTQSAETDGDPDERNLLYGLVDFREYKLVFGSFPNYRIVNPECGDCTTFSSNIQPEFWED